MSLARAAALLAGAALLGTLGCTPPPTVRSETHTQGRETRELDLREVAVAPFRVAELYPRNDPRMTPGPEAAALVERFVSEALQRRGVRVVPAGDVKRVLGIADDPTAAVPPPGIVAKVAAQEFGVPAVLFGTVYRMRDHTPAVMGEQKAASVWFEVMVVRAPGAAKLWNATFNETQRPMNENVLKASRYPGGGTRWLSAEELARWGAGELAREFPTQLP